MSTEQLAALHATPWPSGITIYNVTPMLPSATAAPSAVVKGIGLCCTFCKGHSGERGMHNDATQDTRQNGLQGSSVRVWLHT